MREKSSGALLPKKKCIYLANISQAATLRQLLRLQSGLLLSELRAGQGAQTYPAAGAWEVSGNQGLESGFLGAQGTGEMPSWARGPEHREGLRPPGAARRAVPSPVLSVDLVSLSSILLEEINLALEMTRGHAERESRGCPQTACGGHV